MNISHHSNHRSLLKPSQTKSSAELHLRDRPPITYTARSKDGLLAVVEHAESNVLLGLQAGITGHTYQALHINMFWNAKTAATATEIGASRFSDPALGSEILGFSVPRDLSRLAYRDAAYLGSLIGFLWLGVSLTPAHTEQGLDETWSLGAEEWSGLRQSGTEYTVQVNAGDGASPTSPYGRGFTAYGLPGFVTRQQLEQPAVDPARWVAARFAHPSPSPEQIEPVVGQLLASMVDAQFTYPNQ